LLAAACLGWLDGCREVGVHGVLRYSVTFNQKIIDRSLIFKGLAVPIS